MATEITGSTEFGVQLEQRTKGSPLEARITRDVYSTAEYVLEVVMNMPGIEFLIDRMGRKKAVLIDLKKHKDLWEDLYDAYVARRRRNEPRESLVAVKRLIETKAKRKARG
jgi:hypothetical protein